MVTSYFVIFIQIVIIKCILCLGVIKKIVFEKVKDRTTHKQIDRIDRKSKSYFNGKLRKQRQ